MNSKIDITNKDLKQEDQIMHFLQGKMSHEEETRFLEDIQRDSDFKAKAVNMARLAKGINQVGTEKDAILKEALLAVDKTAVKKIATDAIHTSASASASKRPAGRYFSILSIAASLLCAVYLGYKYYDYDKTTSLGAQYATQYDTSIARGGEQSTAEKEVRGLVDNVYNSKELSNTLKRLAGLWEAATLENYNDYSDYAAEIGWALATGYLKDNNKKDASNVLAKMATLYDADTAMGKRVRELRDILN